MTLHTLGQPRRRTRTLLLCAVAAAGALAIAPAVPAGATLARVGPAAVSASTAGTLQDWGNNSFGQLGEGKTGAAKPDSDVPVKVLLPARVTVTAVQAGCDHVLALTSTGRVLAWGYNAEGQLGDGSATNRDIPVYVHLPAGTKVTAVAAGCYYSLALTSTGRVLAWGYNSSGDLGDGSHVGRETPVQVKLRVKVQAISAGSYFGLALANGHLYAWGDNTYGELGIGSTTPDSDKPVQVKLPAGAKIKTFSAGGDHALAVTTAGRVLAWGYNASGQIGDGGFTNQFKPVQIKVAPAGTGTVTAVSAGCDHSLALTSKGIALAWGFGGDGQLGDGSYADELTAVRVTLPRGTSLRSLTAECLASLAVTTKGRVLAWGDELVGQLGDGSAANRDTPVAVRLARRLTVIAAFAGSSAQQGLVIVR